MTVGSKIGLLLLVSGIALLLSVVGYLPGLVFLVVLGAGFCTTYLVLGGRASYDHFTVLLSLENQVKHALLRGAEAASGLGRQVPIPVRLHVPLQVGRGRRCGTITGMRKNSGQGHRTE